MNTSLFRKSAIDRMSSPEDLDQALVDPVPRGSTLLAALLAIIAAAAIWGWFGSVPLLVEVQRESSILVMQRLRERELEAIQQQARMQNAGMLEQLKNMAAMASGKPAGTV